MICPSVVATVTRIFVTAGPSPLQLRATSSAALGAPRRRARAAKGERPVDARSYSGAGTASDHGGVPVIAAVASATGGDRLGGPAARPKYSRCPDRHEGARVPREACQNAVMARGVHGGLKLHTTGSRLSTPPGAGRWTAPLRAIMHLLGGG